MNLKLFLTVFLTGLILFGCVGGNTPANPPVPGPATNVTPPVNSSQNISPPVVPDTPPVLPNAPTPNPGDSESNNLVGKAWSELIALGTPAECTLRYKDATLVPGFQSATLYMKGKKFKYVVTISQAGRSVTTNIISVDDGFVYITYQDPTMMASLTQGKIECSGLKTSTSGSGATSAVDTSAFGDANKVELTCNPGTFGDELFQVTGKYCTMQEITTALTSGYS